MSLADCSQCLGDGVLGKYNRANVNQDVSALADERLVAHGAMQPAAMFFDVAPLGLGWFFVRCRTVSWRSRLHDLIPLGWRCCVQHLQGWWCIWGTLTQGGASLTLGY